MTDRDDEAAAHRILLALAGRIPDRYLTDLRYTLAFGGGAELTYGIVALVRRHRVWLPEAERELLIDSIRHSGRPDLVSKLPDETAAPDFRFGPFETPGRDPIDLTGEWPAEHEPVDGIDAMALNAIGRYEHVVAVWRCWRYAKGVAAERVYLVEVREPTVPWELAAAVAAALHAVGEADAQVEVYTSDTDLPSYHLLARANGCLLWADSTRMPQVPAPYAGGEQAGTSLSAHPRTTADERVIRYLRDAPVVSEADPAVDVVSPERGAVVPMTVRGDGRWVWPEAVAYYLEKYGLAPDPALLAHLRDAGPPPGYLDAVTMFRARLAVRDELGMRCSEPEPDARPARYRHAPVSPEIMRAAWPHLPVRLDLADPAGSPDLAELLIDRVDRAVLASTRNHPRVLGIWRVWRYPANLPPEHGTRWYFVEFESAAGSALSEKRDLRDAVVAALGQHGATDSATVYGSVDAARADIASVRDRGALLWARDPRPSRFEPRMLARLRRFAGSDGVTMFRAELALDGRRDPLIALRARLPEVIPAPRRPEQEPPRHPPHLSPVCFTGCPPVEELWPQARRTTGPRARHRKLRLLRLFRSSDARARLGRRDAAAALTAASDLLGYWWPLLTEGVPAPDTARRGWSRGGRRSWWAYCVAESRSPAEPTGLVEAARVVLAAHRVRVRAEKAHSMFDTTTELHWRTGVHQVMLQVDRETRSVRLQVDGPTLRPHPAIGAAVLSTVEYLPFPTNTRR
ncbi:hypothetical protein [Nocardia bhagyanarayanae]|uniref:Uncharacterized protein n=1 Tax=Nocardia bhagyanarayanae TaxID=1215925 RepID=A0A543F8W2_9NOCA|nr:hypothetical protein [Nocardia bhagyanarayanae]TQM30253.1 hypothetical protein FB390_1872 [Nocardia bhagyanarayanae]